MDAEILVIGAGMAGLAAAWEINRHGISVKVLERSNSPGGRARTEPLDGSQIDTAAGFLANVYTDTNHIIEDLKLTASKVAIRSRIAVLRGNELRGARSHNGVPPLIPLSSLLRCTKVITPLLSNWANLNLHEPEATFRADTRSLADYAQSVLGDDVLSYLIQPALASTLFWVPERTTQAMFLLLLRSALGMRRFTFSGGVGDLPAALHRRLDVVTGAEVKLVSHSSHYYRAETADGRVYVAKAILVATEAVKIASMLPELPDQYREFFSSVTYSATTILAVHVGNRPLGNYQNILFPKAENCTRYLIGISSIAAKNPQQVSNGGDALRIYCSSEAAHLLALYSDEQIRDLFIQDLCRTPVKLSLSDIKAYRVYRWQHALPEFPVGSLTRLRTFRMCVHSPQRIAFAGDYLGGPSIEGAVTSGIRAARQLLRALS